MAELTRFNQQQKTKILVASLYILHAPGLGSINFQSVCMLNTCLFTYTADR